MFSSKLDGLFRKTALAAVAGSALMLAAQAHAVVVYSGTVNLAIPVSTNGLYLNVVTGANNLPASTGGSTVAGWDINLWSTSGLGFFSPTAPAGGAYVLSATSTVGNLAGSTINASSTFGTGGSTNLAQWNLNSSNNVFGFRFIGEDSQVHYGWARFSLGATATNAARTLVEYAYESTPGVGIVAGVVPEPATYAMMGLGIAGLLLARRRKAA